MTEDKIKYLKNKYSCIKDLDNIWCEDGWADILEKALKLIDWENRNIINIKVVGIKEKWSFLRINTDASNDYIQGALNLLENLSGLICESCGTNREIGKVYKNHIQTLCLSCALTKNKVNDWKSLEALKEEFDKNNPEFEHLKLLMK